MRYAGAMTALRVVLLIASTLAAIAVGVVVLMIAMGRRLRTAETTVRAQVTGAERFLLEPTIGNYGGATGRFDPSKGVAIVAVSDRRLFVAKARGARFEIPLAELVGAREGRGFLGAAGDLPDVILRLRDGVELGLQVREHARWLAVLGEVLGGR